jgi:hypothetical protein
VEELMQQLSDAQYGSFVGRNQIQDGEEERPERGLRGDGQGPHLSGAARAGVEIHRPGAYSRRAAARDPSKEGFI